MLALYSIPLAYRELADQITDAGGELTPEMESRLAALEGDYTQGIEYKALLSRELKAEAAAIAEEGKRLMARSAGLANTAERFLRDAESVMKAFEQTTGESAKVKTKLITVWLQDASRPSIRWEKKDGETLAPIPVEFQRIKIELDSDKALAQHKAGGLPDGFTVELSRTIRTK